MTTEEVVRIWWFNDVLNKRDISLYFGREADNARNLLAGFLQSCEKFGHLDKEKAESLFKELAK